MPGYPRPGVAFRWLNWWVPMGLLRDEEDDWEVIEAEDAAIAAGDVPPEQDTDLATLTEILSDGRAPDALPEAHDKRKG